MNKMYILILLLLFNSMLISETIDVSEPLVPVKVDYFQEQPGIINTLPKVTMFKKVHGFEDVIFFIPVTETTSFWATPFAVFYNDGEKDTELFNYEGERKNLIYNLHFLKEKLFIITNSNGVFIHDTADGKWTHLNTANFLENNSIYCARIINDGIRLYGQKAIYQHENGKWSYDLNMPWFTEKELFFSDKILVKSINRGLLLREDDQWNEVILESSYINTASIVRLGSIKLLALGTRKGVQLYDPTFKLIQHILNNRNVIQIEQLNDKLIILTQYFGLYVYSLKTGFLEQCHWAEGLPDSHLKIFSILNSVFYVLVQNKTLYKGLLSTGPLPSLHNKTSLHTPPVKISNAIGPNIVGVPLSVKTLRIPQTQGTKHSISFLGEDRDTGGNYLKRFKYAKGIVCAYFSKENYMHNFPDSAECYVIPKIFRTDNREESIRGWAGRYNGVLPKDCYLQIPEKATKTCYWDDHGEAYPIEFEGPDILLEIKTKMPSTISLYFAAANRDYIISCFDKRPFPRNPIPAVTTTRANNLMYGKYYSFYVSCEDNKVYFLINRGHNINTTLSGIFIE